MAEFLIFVSVLIGAIYLFIRLITLKQQMKSMIKQLGQITGKQTRETIKVSLVDKDIEELANCINTSIKEQRRLYIDTKSHESKLKQQIANISHDLRTPLSSINGYIQLLEKDDLDSKQRSQYLSIIRQKSTNLNTLIHNFFELSVIDSDDYILNIDKIDINSVISNTLISNYTLFKEKGIEPHVDLPGRAVYIMSDSTACQRIVQNLLTNAIRYTSQTIYIELNESDKGTAIFSISNEAENLSDEDIAHLFDRFYTGDRSRADGNTGLGLYIVKILVEKTGGNVSASLENGILRMQVEFS